MAIDEQTTAAPWRDPAAPTQTRVRDLISRMTPAEKTAQLYGVWIGIHDADGEVAPHQHDLIAPIGDWDALIRDGIGQLTRAFGTRPVDPATGAAAVARTQRQITTAGRFAIPALVHEEILTGLAAWHATVYPNPLSWGATFDPDLIQRLGAQIGRTAHRLGIHQGLAPVLDVTRDPRWGRTEETIAEDPYLVGTLAAAYVRGVQSQGVIATLKHFAGYSASRAARNLAPVSLGPRELNDTILPPFEHALHAGARSVMNAYTDLDGLPTAADPTLLTHLLRDTYGFTGTVVADYFAITFLQTLHHVAATPAEAAALALEAGIDVELPTFHCYRQPLLNALETGQIDPAIVDRALERVLRQKCELGLLDADWNPEPEALRDGDTDLDPPESRALAREIAERSIVLLRNQDNTLPLTPGRRIALVGPRAHDPSAMLGCYSFPQHVGVHHPDTPLGIDIPTVLEALREDPAGYQITYAQGVPVLGGDDAGIEQAVHAARDAQLCIAVLGDRAGLFGAGTSGEGCDATDLHLPGRQEQLLEALLNTGTPVILILLAGRPYELSRQADRLAAILCGFFPGEAGAHALTDILAGRVNPTGRLPITFPATGTNQPSTYLAPPLARTSDVSNIHQTPLYPFGHGLSYAPATWGETTLRSAQQWPTDGTCTLTATLHNPTHLPTAEVVQVYLHDPVAEVARPVQKLIAAPRIDLAPGQTRTVTIELHADLTAYTGRTGQRQVDPGDIELWIGASSTDIRTTLQLTMTGERRQVGYNRVMQPTIHTSTETPAAETAKTA